MGYRDLLSKRNTHMAFAIIWIVLFHMKYVSWPAPFDSFINIGYAGSDIFYFVSGIGIWLSLVKCRDVKEYYKKRVLRIMPMYWCFIGFWIAFRLIFSELKPVYIALNILGIAAIFDMDQAFNWYISYLIVFYLVAPLVKILMDDLSGIVVLLSISSLVIFLGYFIIDSADIMIGLTRFPVFMLGMYFGKRINDNPDGLFSVWEVLLWIALIPVGIGLVLFYGNDFLSSWQNGMLWYPLFLCTPGICIVLSLIFGPLPGWMNLPFNFIGSHTLSIYFIHILFFEIYEKCFVDAGLVEPLGHYWLYVLAAVIMGCVVLELLSWLVVRPFVKRGTD